MTTLLSETHTPTSVNKGRRVLLISITRSGTLKQRKGTPGKCRRGGTGGSQGGEKKRTEDGHGVPPGPRPLPVPQPLRPRTTELGPPPAVPALTSCSEQRKMSVQRPVQQPMVAERRGCSSASLRAAGRSGGSPHPDGAAASPSPPPRRPPASAFPPPLSDG